VSELTSLGELARQGRVVLNDGYRTKADELGVPGVPILRVGEVHDGFITPSFGDHVHENFRSKFAAKMSAAGDIVVTTKGTVGRVALMREDHPEFVYSPQVCFFRCSAGSGIAPEWLYFWFKGPEFMVQALGVQSQTDMAPYINLADMRSISITVPPMREQRAIAGVLGALDDKIESNRRKNGLLRMLIGAIYEDKECKATDFEPLTNWATLTKGTEPGRDKCNEEKLGIPFIRVGDLSRDEAALYTTFANCECADEDSVLVSFDGTPGRVATAMSGAFSSGIRRADPRSAHVSPGLLLAALESASVQRTIAEYASGTTILHAGAAIPHIRVPLWGQSQLLELSVELENLRRGIVASTRETRVLQNIRETLLPELLSGRLRVKDAEKVVEGAV
jgi:type I restriction enzyme S subunit